VSARAQATPILSFILCAALLAGARSAPGLPQAGPAAGAEGELILALDAVTVAAGDLDGDGAGDWLAALPGGGILRRTPDGDAVIAPGTAVLDLAVASGESGTPGFAAAALAGGGIALLVPGDGEPPEVLAPELAARAVALADVDGDGLLDVVLASAGEGVLVLFGAGGGAVLSDLTALDIAAGDFLGTGKPAFALAGPGGVMSLLDAEGQVLLSIGAPPIAHIAAADLDGDGVDEVAAGDGDGALYIVDFKDGSVRTLEPGPGEIEVLDPFIVVGPSAPPLPEFLRGDANEDGEVNLSDPIAVFNDLFLGVVARASCRKALDANDDGDVNISDGVFVLNFLFSNGRPIPPPYPGPGVDPTPDPIPCEP
jgi:hypothetical protein